MIILRDYQEEAVESALEVMQAGRHPVCALPTGSGKSVVIAAVCERLGGRILVATHRKELLEQNEATLSNLGDADTGIYSAGLRRRDMDSRVVFGGIQSIYKRMDDLQEVGAFDYIIVDEAHLCPPPSVKSSMYSSVFGACEKAKRFGLSATPYRLDDGPIFGGDTWFDELSSNASMESLMYCDTPWLSKLVGVEGAAEIDTSNVRVRAGEFVESELAEIASNEAIVSQAIDEIKALTDRRKSVLIFTINRLHADLVLSRMLSAGMDAAMILGNTHSDERRDLIGAFKSRELRYLINVGVLTTGFDAPVVDCLVMMRPTMSKSLCVQMIGRGTRLFEGKRNCLVLDLSGNLDRHTPLDGIPRVYHSPKKVLLLTQEEEERKVEQERAKLELAGKQQTKAIRGIDPLRGRGRAFEEPVELTVTNMMYKPMPAKNKPGKTNLMAIYQCQSDEGTVYRIPTWITIEYPGDAGIRARQWFERRGVRMPMTTKAAMGMVYGLKRPMSIVVKKNDRNFFNVLVEHFSEG